MLNLNIGGFIRCLVLIALKKIAIERIVGEGRNISQPKNKIKICCFCEQWESGGIESFLNNVLHHLNLEKFQVDIVTSSLKPSVFTDGLQKLNVRFFELSGTQKKLMKNYRIFWDILQREKYDVLHLNIFHGLSLYYAKLAKQAGVPIRIAHSHNTDFRESPTKFIKLFLHRIIREWYSCFATELWACSESAAKFMFSKKELERKQFKFIPDGIDTERFHFDAKIREEVRKELHLDGKFVIGHVGRLCFQKNQLFILNILKKLMQHKAESYLLIVGEGEDKITLQETAKRLGVTDHVIFYGVTNQVEHLLFGMDMFVFPSRFEGFGIAVIEAQAAGLSVVCSENIPNEALITERTVQLSLSDGADVWAKAILERENNKADRSIEADRVSAAGFDLKVVAEIVAEHWMEGDSWSKKCILRLK